MSDTRVLTDKFYAPPDIPTDTYIRLATAEERALYMKNCLTAKENQEIHVMDGVIRDVFRSGWSMSTPEGAKEGAERRYYVGARPAGYHAITGTTGGHYLLAAAITKTKLYVNSGIEFDVDFLNGHEYNIDSLSVLHYLDHELNVLLKPDTPCKLYWVKKGKKYVFRYVIPEGVTHNTPVVQCRCCSKHMRKEDLEPGDRCIYCHQPINSRWRDFFKPSFGTFLAAFGIVAVISLFLAILYVFIFLNHGQLAPIYPHW